MKELSRLRGVWEAHPPWRTRRSLRRLLVFWFVGIAVISCAAVGTLTYFIRAGSIHEMARGDLMALRDAQVSIVSAWFAEKLEALDELSRSRPVLDLLAQHARSGKLRNEDLPAFLEGFRSSHGAVALAVLDESGTPLQDSSGWVSEGHTVRHFAAALKAGKPTVQGEAIRCRQHRLVEVVMAAPVRPALSGDPAGLLVMTVDLQPLRELLQTSGHLRETGETLLFDRDGVLQSQTRFSETAQGELRLVDFEAPPQRGDVSEGTDYRGVRVLQAYGDIHLAGWRVLTKQDFTEIYQPVRQMARQVALVTLLVCLLSMGAGLAAARSLAEPARKIAEVAQRIGDGDTEVRAAEEGPPEMGIIARHLNLMVDVLARRIRVNDALSGIYAAAATHSETAALFSDVLPKLLTVTRSQSGLVYLAGEDPGEFALALAHGMPRESIREKLCLNPPDCLLARAVQSGQVVQTGPVPGGSELKVFTPAGESTARSILCFPLILSGQPVACIGLASLYDYRAEDIEIAESLRMSLGASIGVCLGAERTARLADKLQASNEELATVNEELQAQSEELSKQAEELERQRARAEEASRLKSAFLSNMSHELRTPLNSILTLTQLLSRRSGTEAGDSKETGYLRIIERNGQNLLQLINDILDLSKVESGRLEMLNADFDPRLCAEQAVDTVRPLAEQKGLRLEYSFEKNLPTVRSDENRVRQVLVNLLSNAVKFTSAGRVFLAVSCAGGDQIRCRVEDTGIGIAPGQLETVFEEFRQGDDSVSRTYEGTGLGLAISRKLARLLGGDITVVSEPLRGSVFTFVLPVRRSLRPSDSTEGLVSGAPRPPGEVPEVLVVEDNDIAVLQVRSVLNEFGCLVKVASTGTQAMEALRDWTPSAVVLDLMLPEMDGFQVLEHLRSDPRTEQVPALVLTAMDLTAEQRVRLQRQNAQQLMVKGTIDREAFERSIARLLATETAG